MNVRHTTSKSGSADKPTVIRPEERRESHTPALDREIEPKVGPCDTWLEAEQSVGDDFDVAAWFAREAEESRVERCITECWYG